MDLTTRALRGSTGETRPWAYVFAVSSANGTGRAELPLELRRALARGGHIVIVGGGTGREVDDGVGLWELMSLMIKGMVLSRFVRPREMMFFASIPKADLAFLLTLIETGQLTPVIDRTYPLDRAADAIRHLEFRARPRQVIVTV